MFREFVKIEFFANRATCHYFILGKNWIQREKERAKDSNIQLISSLSLKMIKTTVK